MNNQLQQVKSEIEKQIEATENGATAYILADIIKYIDSLQEEPTCIYNRTLEERQRFCRWCSAACEARVNPVSDDLKEAAELSANGAMISRQAALFNTVVYNPQTKCFNYSDLVRQFKAGAEWQKQQMEKSVIAEQKCTCVQVMHRIVGGSWNLACPIDKLGLGSGDKVKLIIIKED